MIEDVTGRKELEAQMREAQKMEAVGRLAGGIAHDFNNILTVVSGYTELLRDQLPEEAHADVDTILDSVKRASDLTRQLLTFSRRQGPTLTVIDSAETFRDTELLMRNVIGADVTLETRMGMLLRGGCRSGPAQPGGAQPRRQCTRRDAGRWKSLLLGRRHPGRRLS